MKDKEFHYSVNEQQKGPVSFAELQQAEVSLDAMVWFEGLEEWERLGDIPELTHLLGNKTEEQNAETYMASDPEIFQHPEDIEAIRAIQKLKGIDLVSAKITELEVDNSQYMKQVTSSLLVTENQLPKLHDILLRSSQILDIAPPLLFIGDIGRLNSLALGIQKPFIVLSNNLVEAFDEGELSFVIGHELGHHKCRHMIYITMLSVIRELEDHLSQKGLGLASLVTTGISYALTYWYRKSALSCDRAGLLVCKDINASISALVKISGFPSTQYGTFNAEEFIKQAELHEDFDKSLLNIYHKMEFMRENVINNPRPLPVLRAKELHDWQNSKEYENIINGNFDEVEKKHLSGPDEQEEDLNQEFGAEEKTDFATEAKGVAEDAAQGLKNFLGKL